MIVKTLSVLLCATGILASAIEPRVSARFPYGSTKVRGVNIGMTSFDMMHPRTPFRSFSTRLHRRLARSRTVDHPKSV